jgi:magnesium chelatase family protein
MRPAEIRQFCSLDGTGQSLMRSAMSQFRLTARAYHRVLKLARTIADLAGSDPSPRSSGGSAAVSARLNSV